MWSREPKHVPRTAAILRPRPAFIDWVNRHARDGLQLPENEEEEQGVIYLLPELNDAAGARNVIRKQARRILKYHLWLYVTDKKVWPKRLDMAQLEAFFSVEYLEDVVDLT